MSSEKTKNEFFKAIIGGRKNDDSLIDDNESSALRHVDARADGLGLFRGLGAKSAIESALSGITHQKSVSDKSAEKPNHAIFEAALGGRMSNSHFKDISGAWATKEAVGLTGSLGLHRNSGAKAAWESAYQNNTLGVARALGLLEGLGAKSALQEALLGITKEKSIFDEITKKQIKDISGVSAHKDAVGLTGSLGLYGNSGARAAWENTSQNNTLGAARALGLLEGSGAKSALQRALLGITEQKSIFDEIAKKQNILDGMQKKDVFRIDPELFRGPPLPVILPNPIHETNDRLESVEQKLEAMVDVMERSARIATDLQQAAAGFIEKFETSARQTEGFARIAILLSLMSFLFTFGAFAYTEFYKGPKDAAYQAAMIKDIRQELAANREANLVGAQQVADSILASEKRAEEIINASSAKAKKKN
jgi:hypothetical protein